MKKTSKAFGVALVALASAIIIETLIRQLSDTGAMAGQYGIWDYLYDLFMEGVLVSLAIFVTGFLPGLFYYRFGKGGEASSRLVSSALVLHFISILAMAVAIAISMTAPDSNGLSDGGLILVSIIPTSVAYAVGILLLIIYKVRNRKAVASTQ
ncbi:MAG TPA: hypothetical protein VGE35_02900 [Candidatus Paceibacterota bacterium]